MQRHTYIPQDAESRATIRHWNRALLIFYSSIAIAGVTFIAMTANPSESDGSIVAQTETIGRQSATASPTTSAGPIRHKN